MPQQVVEQAQLIGQCLGGLTAETAPKRLKISDSRDVAMIASVKGSDQYDRVTQPLDHDGQFFTPQEVAGILGIPEERVFVLSLPVFDDNTKRLKPILWPSAIIDKPVELKRIVETGKNVVDSHLAEYGGGQEFEVVYETLSGIFGVDTAGGLRWDVNRANVDRLERGEYIYTPVAKLTVLKKQIVFTRFDLEHYLAEVGDTSTVLPDYKQERERLNQINEAATLLKRQQTAELDKIVDEIMVKIDKIVQEARQNRSLTARVINHIRFIREAAIPQNKFESVKKKVALRIKDKYDFVGFRSLARRPKENDPYLLSK